MTFTIILLSFVFVAGWMAHHIGYCRGYENGKEDEINRCAERAARLKRFYEPHSSSD